jgi:hypothetical protein
VYRFPGEGHTGSLWDTPGRGGIYVPCVMLLRGYRFSVGCSWGGVQVP